MARLSGNKGEWSEIYVLFKLLADGKVYAADELLNKKANMFFPLLKIIREETVNKHCEYKVEEHDKKLVKVYLNSENVLTLPAHCFSDEAKYLLDKINTSNGVFSSERTENFMSKILCDKIKAPSRDKSDITVQLHDIKTGFNPICGFSIKSELGNQPTLLNASLATNFKYEVKGLNYSLISKINGIDTGSKLQDRFKKIKDHCKKIEFICLKNSIFASNLCFIDTKMPDIVALALLYRFQYNENNIDKVIMMLETDNPLRFPAKGLYEFKFKQFLRFIALGMKPSKQWDGKDEATGGYLVVLNSGVVLAFYIYNRNSFEDYLFNNTIFESASTSRHQYGSLYIEDGSVFFDLNLQIRFKNHKEIYNQETSDDSIAATKTPSFL